MLAQIDYFYLTNNIRETSVARFHCSVALCGMDASATAIPDLSGILIFLSHCILRTTCKAYPAFKSKLYLLKCYSEIISRLYIPMIGARYNLHASLWNSATSVVHFWFTRALLKFRQQTVLLFSSAVLMSCWLFTIPSNSFQIQYNPAIDISVHICKVMADDFIILLFPILRYLFFIYLSCIARIKFCIHRSEHFLTVLHSFSTT